MTRDLGNKGLRKGLTVYKTLMSGEIMVWRTLDEVANAAALNRNEAYAALIVLEEFGLAEKGNKGFRASAGGIAMFTVKAKECLIDFANKWGL